MDGFHDPNDWEDQEVHIEDLGAPETGLDRFLFSLGDKWHVVSRFWRPSTLRMVPLGVLVFLLLSSSALLSPAASPSFSAIPHEQGCDALQVPPTGGIFASPPADKFLVCSGVPGNPGSLTPLPIPSSKPGSCSTDTLAKDACAP